MADNDHRPPWYEEWREALGRVVAATMARDAAQPGTPEREAAEREHEVALAIFCEVANRIR
jgi:hypothetical protein